MSLVRLIYVSDPPPGYDASGLDVLLAPVRASALRNNLNNGLTGVLVFSPDFFAQALEGTPDAVEATFARIVADPRHDNVRVVEKREINQRIFQDWAMAFIPAKSTPSLRNSTPQEVLRALVAATSEYSEVRAIPGLGVVEFAPIRA